MLRVARAHYVADRSLVQISEDEGISRFQVARLVKFARDSGIVEVRVHDEADENHELAEQLTAVLGVTRCIVVGRSRALGMMPTLDSVASAVARELARVVRPGQRLGLTWSRVIEKLPEHVKDLAPGEVVQLAGALSFDGDRLGSVEVIRQVARASGGTAYPFYAPLWVGDARTAASLSAQPEIARCLELIADLDVAVVSVGHWGERGSAVYPLLPRELAEQVRDEGCIGEVSGRLLDRHGASIDSRLDDQIIGITAEQLRAVPERIATTYGEYRAEATIAAVRAGFISTLVLDEPQAARILAMLEEAG
ncbi:hypothetical protein BH708_16105 [Brachybacterium sp. P6-10-X1]|nr:hypothetical protein BH708_16105 [Brachybacterium sp. P6-10-X1]